MASSTLTPTRRVLGDLNVNTPTGRGAMQPSKLGAGSPAKPPQVGETYLTTDFNQNAETAKVCEEDRLGSRKRSSDVSPEELPNKRIKTTPSPKAAREGVLLDAGSSQALEGGLFEAPVLQSPSSRQTVVYNIRSSPSAAASSPVSSLGSRHADLDDSQNTTITEPDDVPLPATLPTLPRPVSIPLTMTEIREKADTLRLRLQLASYKVRTNQIDVPMSRLEIKTTGTSPELPRLPRLPTTASQRRAPLPSTATALPNIQLQTPSTEKRRAHHTQIPSSPPPYLEVRQHKSGSPTKETNTTRGAESEGCTTPLLPRQRQGMLHPPSLGSPIWADERSREKITSSVVKSRAANGLLSLRSQQ